MTRTPALAALFAAVMSITALAASPVLAEDASPAAGNEKTVLGDARQAGIRYGQAAGVEAVCYNMRATAKAEGLASAFTGAELDTFKTQAESVVTSWKKTLACAHAADPNPCRLAHQMSCKEAFREIGPNGTVVSGLIELKPNP